MKRWLYHQETVRGSFAQLDRALRRDVRTLLADVTGTEEVEPTPEGDILVRLPTAVLGRDLRKVVRLHTGVAEQHGPRTCIPLRWRAEPGGALFPAFEGVVELEPLASTRAALTVVGAATVPLGALGGAADATALRSIAERTVAHLTRRLAAALEAAASGPANGRNAPATSAIAMRVRDVMTSDPLLLHVSMPIRTAALLLFHYDVAGAPVTDDAGGLVGVLSEADLLDVVAPPRYGLGHDAGEAQRRRAAATVGEACSRPAREVAASAPLADAAAMMRDHEVARLVVVDASGIAGVVSRHDVLRALVRSDADIQASVDRVLADRDEGDVVAAVDWGAASLHGRLYARSGVAALTRDVRAVDGVVSVDASGLTWDLDDMVPPQVPMI